MLVLERRRESRSALYSLGTLPVGAWLYMEGTLSLPVFLISLVVPMGVVAPLMKVSEAMEQVSMIKGNLEQVTAFLKPRNLSGPLNLFLWENGLTNLRMCISVTKKPKFSTVFLFKRSPVL